METLNTDYESSFILSDTDYESSRVSGSSWSDGSSSPTLPPVSLPSMDPNSLHPRSAARRSGDGASFYYDSVDVSDMSTSVSSEGGGSWRAAHAQQASHSTPHSATTPATAAAATTPSDNNTSVNSSYTSSSHSASRVHARRMAMETRSSSSTAAREPHASPTTTTTTTTTTATTTASAQASSVDVADKDAVHVSNEVSHVHNSDTSNYDGTPTKPHPPTYELQVVGASGRLPPTYTRVDDSTAPLGIKSPVSTMGPGDTYRVVAKSSDGSLSTAGSDNYFKDVCDEERKLLRTFLRLKQQMDRTDPTVTCAEVCDDRAAYTRALNDSSREMEAIASIVSTLLTAAHVQYEGDLAMADTFAGLLLRNCKMRSQVNEYMLSEVGSGREWQQQRAKDGGVGDSRLGEGCVGESTDGVIVTSGHESGRGVDGGISDSGVVRGVSGDTRNHSASSNAVIAAVVNNVNINIDDDNYYYTAKSEDAHTSHHADSAASTSYNEKSANVSEQWKVVVVDGEISPTRTVYIDGDQHASVYATSATATVAYSDVDVATRSADATDANNHANNNNNGNNNNNSEDVSPNNNNNNTSVASTSESVGSDYTYFNSIASGGSPGGILTKADIKPTAEAELVQHQRYYQQHNHNAHNARGVGAGYGEQSQPYYHHQQQLQNIQNERQAVSGGGVSGASGVSGGGYNPTPQYVQSSVAVGAQGNRRRSSDRAGYVSAQPTSYAGDRPTAPSSGGVSGGGGVEGVQARGRRVSGGSHAAWAAASPVNYSQQDRGARYRSRVSSGGVVLSGAGAVSGMGGPSSPAHHNYSAQHKQARLRALQANGSRYPSAPSTRGPRDYSGGWR